MRAADAAPRMLYDLVPRGARLTRYTWKKSLFRPTLALVTAAACAASTGCDKPDTGGEQQQPPPAVKHRTIIFVWDGLRPDSINPVDTPNAYALMKRGVWFSDNHSTYPTFTMINGATFATGAFPGATGFNGNYAYAPGGSGKTASGGTANYSAPIATEDWAVLDGLNAYYQQNFHEPLLNAQTLFSAAQGAGLKTATVGKTGPAYIQDYTRGGLIIDENAVFPLSVAHEMQAKGFSLPVNAPNMYAPGELTLAQGNGTPTTALAMVTLNDGVTSDASDAGGGRFLLTNRNLTNYFTSYVLNWQVPDLSLLWLRTVDATQHDYGPGSKNYFNAIQAQDGYLGQVIAQLSTQELLSTTNILIASDHAHSTVSGPLGLFPLRALEKDATTGKNKVGAQSANGFPVSGFVRAADLLTRAGFHAYDGLGCDYTPVFSGILADGSSAYPVQVDTTGAICGTANAKYTTPPYLVPATLPADAILVAAPGGSEQFYVPSHDPELVRRLVTFLQKREEFGAIFVDGRYGSIPGTFTAASVNLQNASGRNPDVTVSYTWDDQVRINGKPGIEFQSAFAAIQFRGMHGSFSPVDAHNTLIAAGPDFKVGYSDPLPSGNVDVAPTVAHLLGLSLPSAQGRVLSEALVGGSEDSAYTVTPMTSNTSPVSGLQFQLPTDPSGATLDTGLAGDYSATLQTKQLKDASGATYTYFDFARVTRR